MLTSKQLMDIKKLQNVCEAGESFELKLNWDMLKAEDNTDTKGFFHYVDEKLVGFIGLYGFGNKVELCGMVHPDFRRRGIFTQLYQEAQIVMNECGYKKILLNAPANSESAKGFLTSIPCSYSLSEHQMKWEEKEMVQYDDVSLRLSTPDDFELEVQLEVQCFGFEEEEAIKYNQQKNREEDENYIILSGEQAVGKMRVSHYDGEAWIYGFAILPDYQGQGIGRKALSNVVVKEHQNGNPIFLEVEAKNANALRLYESCGFRAYHSQDYYEKK
ncbi:GNAT family N-acetyltransferase [Bacillus sp. S/N-304-OC-R1]|uniref:GNAT family N-acetyltransferase n=1 Tax=Bacillus sp. S/N-304-OC-R1 TaxID=2758034 RepID=UPI0021AE6148|nr:GNAT family N-acetyltransferase [Bacillus sp. S/N-304-OC-R1]